MAAGGDDASGTVGLPGRARPPFDHPGKFKRLLAAETLRLYAGDWARFQQFCAERGEQALPARPDVVAAFLSGPSSGKAILSRRLAAIDHQHRQRGLLPPGADIDVRVALRQARRTAPILKREPAPKSATLVQMAAGCRSDLVGKRDRAVLLLLASGLGRAAIVALQAEQLRFEDSGVLLHSIVAEGTPVTLVPFQAAAACPARAVEDWLRSSGTRYGPVFRKINRWGQLEHQALGADAIRLILARHAEPPRARRKR